MTDIAWLAGLFEGEGSMEIGKNGMVRLCIRMTDRDIIDRVNAMFPARKIQVVVPEPMRDTHNQPKTQYAWRISGPERVREVLDLIMPWLGERRTVRAGEVLAHLDARPGTPGWFHRNKTHCAQGHEYTPENTYIRPGTDHRHCRACRNDWARQYRERSSALVSEA